ncbi:hypothetical protein A9Q84_03125 [Halobacteriovorax marinus]|uniref:Radical SAM core domain-containing protein n=1 Tax=Halobacteriovorax marinus TaxID=97084 RepID=A0A1Y5FCV6_9BACT|nr:hypothetical protein A9Q84_03125 [Halobacteriovorax marinus]
MKMKELNIILGHKCNYSCTHCVNSSGPDLKSSRLSTLEVENIKSEIINNEPSLILFTGGEPTLYIDDMNTFINCHPSKENATFGITTNGWFGYSKTMTEKTLNKIEKLTFLQVSFDAFHGTETKFENISNIKKYCDDRDITFNISMAISEPMDLLLAQEIIRDLGVKVVFQKVSKVGRAKENNITYKYFSFEESVLDEKCPNIDSFTYIPGQGYSNCCGNLVYNNITDEICHKDFESFTNSNIYNTLKTKTFREILKEKNIDTKKIPNECSSACNLCEYAFKGAI